MCWEPASGPARAVSTMCHSDLGPTRPTPHLLARSPPSHSHPHHTAPGQEVPRNSRTLGLPVVLCVTAESPLGPAQLAHTHKAATWPLFPPQGGCPHKSGHSPHTAPGMPARLLGLYCHSHGECAGPSLLPGRMHRKRPTQLRGLWAGVPAAAVNVADSVGRWVRPTDWPKAEH